MKLDYSDKKVKPYNPSEKQREIRDYVKKRVDEMKEYRKSLKIEEEWKDADNEYIPSELDSSNGKKRFESDDELGLRSRLVPVGQGTGNWRSNNSTPMLLVKIQSALSIILDRNPEAFFSATEKKYQKGNTLAYGFWKRNWELTKSKEVLKLFVFNLIKYGWAVGRSYPRTIKMYKRVLTEYDPENPDNNKYEDKEEILFDDVWKENLDPFKTWIDETARPYEPLSMKECYYEIDYTFDEAEREFSRYKGWNYVTLENSKKEDDEDLQRKDIITIGFFQSRSKDVYSIYVPSQDVCIYDSPLLNDDGYLDLWHTFWIMRDAKSPYGLSLWQIIRQNKALYDKMDNMTMDQLVLSIMKMAFTTGTTNVGGDGTVRIEPGAFVHLLNGDIKFLEIPGPGKESWEGKQELKSRIDDDSGMTPTLEGDVTGKTLGEILHAKEASLKRLKIPIENISDAIEQDAYISISWMYQKYSTPQVKEFDSELALLNYEREEKVEHQDLYQDENGKLKASFYPQLSLHLEDRDGEFTEAKEPDFFQIGKEIPLNMLSWRGVISVIPKSLISPSLELEKQRKQELFNFLAPLFPQPPELYKKAVKQLLEINEEEPEDWLPDSWLVEPEKNPIFIEPEKEKGIQIPEGMKMNFAELPKEAQQKILEQSGMMPGSQQRGQNMMQNQQPQAIQPNQGAETLLPQSQMMIPETPSAQGQIRGELR